MASFQDLAGKRQQRYRHGTPTAEHYEWEPRRAESRHSLPYRSRQPELQKTGRRRPKPSSHPSRTAEDLALHSMPPPPRLLTRSATTHSRGRPRYEDSDDDDDDDETTDEDEDEDDEENEKERLRGRLRSRSRSRAASRPQSRGASRGAPKVKIGAQSGSGMKPRARSRVKSRATSRVQSRPTSLSSRSTESIYIATPTRSSYIPMRSAPSPGATTDDSTDDSDDSSDFSQDHRRRRTRTLKERMNGTPDSEPAFNQSNRSRSRPPSPEKFVPEVESPSEHSGDQAHSHPRIIVKRQPSRRRHRQQSRSPSRDPRRRKHGEARASFSPKRQSQKYYNSDFAASEKAPFSRSRATSASRVTPPYSHDSSSKPSSTYPANFFPTPALPQAYDRDPKSHVCVECGESVNNLAKLKCGHRWCESCLKKRFKASVKDARSMPPKCCTSDIIPLKHVNDLFNDEFKRTWNKKFREHSTRNRNYCPKSKCRERIWPEDICHHKNGRSSATCRECETKICGLCFNKWHESKHCPAPANTGHWKRCFNCKAMVELKEGSNHMTCRCGARFCMICEARWKACKCPSFHYEMEDEDEMEHVQIPIAMVSRERLGGGFDSAPRGPRPGWPPARDYRGEEPTGRQPHARANDDDGYVDDINDDIDIGNTAGHFMDEYRMSQGAAPPPAVPLPPPSVAPDRANSGANYVSGVNKARGVRASSMERRLADRFSDQRQGTATASHHRYSQQHYPSHAGPSMGMGPPPVQAPMAPSPISRRHTMDNDMYEIPFDHRYSAPPAPRRGSTREYMDDFDIHVPVGRRRMRQAAPPPPSALAGLTGAGNGMNRVNEWMDHVDPYPPDSQTVA